MLFAQARAALFPDRPFAFAVEAMIALADADRFRQEMVDAGLADPVIHARTHDFVVPADFFAKPGTMVTDSPLLAGLPRDEAARVIARAARDATEYQVGDSARLPGTAHLVLASKR